MKRLIVIGSPDVAMSLPCFPIVQTQCVYGTRAASAKSVIALFYQISHEVLCGDSWAPRS